MTRIKNLQFSVKAALGLMLSIALAFGVYRVIYPWHPTVDYERIEREVKSLAIRTAEELNQANEHEYLILFIDADWSMTAIQSSVRFIALREKLKDHSSYSRITFRSIDITDQSDSLFQHHKSWFAAHSMALSDWCSGSGQLILVKSGKVKDIIHCPAVEKFEDVLARTQTFLKSSN